ncbi:MAG TPA: DNA cytosine methyltransferase [Gallionellaceae bacterium]|nr:DNA cytosine methyltransferase [Gallionellaceae bacterium]
MITPQLILDINEEIIIDNFAGGGGASTGIEIALGRHVDVAINHDPEAVAMHSANHPQTRHYCESVWEVNPRDVEPGRPIGLLWLSPDCKHFSKAKGGKPVEKKIRGLAWVALRWAAIRKPRVIMLENVEEFVTWGPLVEGADGNMRPCPKNKGREFNAFRNALQRQGYTVEHKELRACDFGAPTIRKRLFLIARRDGQPIVWPTPTHGDPKKDDVKNGKLKPWRTAAECIDWSIPCPSIFLSKEEARVLGVIRPLADNTLRRVAKGIMRYVVNAAEPFIVTAAHGEGKPGAPQRWGKGHRSMSEPLPTITASGGYGLVTPFITEHANGSNQRNMAADEPLRTQCAQVKGGHFALIAPTLIQTGYGERAGQSPRAPGLDKPLGTVVAGGAKHALVAPIISTYYGDKNPNDVRGIRMDEPLQTQTTENRHALVSAFMAKHYGGVVGHDLHDEPLHTVTSTDHNSLVSAHLTKFRSGSVGSELSDPIHTITAGGNPARDSTGNVHGIVTSNLVKMRGDNIGQPDDEPLHTLSAQGTHFAEVRAFLVKYYGNEQDGVSLNEPNHTVTARDRFGLVTVHGEEYAITDIGLRMLAPRELFRAQGFPEHYIIGDKPEQGLKLTKSAQVRMCGNSVCPPLATALVRANLANMAAIKETKRKQA